MATSVMVTVNRFGKSAVVKVYRAAGAQVRCNTLL